MLEDSQLQNQLRFFEQLLEMRHKVNELLNEGVAGARITVREWELLIYISQRKYTNAKELANFFGITSTLISKNIWHLVKRNLVQSQVDLNDRRIVKISITSDGQSTVRSIEQQVICNLKKIRRDNELESLRQQITGLTKNLADIKP